MICVKLLGRLSLSIGALFVDDITEGLVLYEICIITIFNITKDVLLS